MNFNVKSVLAVALLSFSTAAMAQELQSGYFTDGYLYRHDMNPAIANERNYVSMPILGNLNLNVRGNVNLKNFLYNVDGRTVTFMHPDVSADQFLKTVKDKNRLTQSLKLQIMSAGFKAWGGYNTIELNLKQNLNVAVPGDALRMLKEGITNKDYNIGNLGANAQAYMEIGLGHSHKIDEHWRVGGKVKVLIGAARMDANFDNTAVRIDANNGISTKVDGQIEANVKGFEYQTDGDGNMNGMKINGAGVGGAGLAFDLGAEYKLNDDWKFSLSFLDLGFISWNTNAVAKASGEWNSNDYTYNFDTKKYQKADGTEIDVKDIYQLKPEAGSKGKTKGLGATMHIGAEYTLPVYRPLTFGLLNTTRINGKYSWTEFRLSANIAPCKVFSAGINYAIGTYGSSFGWIANLHTKGFCLFVGMDHTLGKLAKQGIPLSSNANVAMGINFPF